MSNKVFFGSIVALITPMHEDGSIDYPAMDRLIDWHVEQGTKGIVSVGTTGESATLDSEEHIEVISRCVKKVAKRIPVIAGSGSNSTQEAIELSQEAKKVGADATLQVVPYYNKPPARGLLAHFLAIADAVDLPHILYNVPGRTVIDLMPDTVIEAAKHPGIVGIKDASMEIDRVTVLREGCGEDFSLLSGEDSTLYEFMHAGGDGIISVTANLLPAKMAQVCEVMAQGDHNRGKELHEELMKAHAALFVEPNPMPLKWVMGQAGMIEPGLRLPLVELDPIWHDTLRQIIPN